MKRITIKSYWVELKKFEKRFLKEKQFPSLPNPYENRLQPIMHTGYLIFIRAKFLYLGLLKSLQDRNLYAAYSILKSYWENIAAFGYYHLMVSKLTKNGYEEKAFSLARKMGLGGRGFLTEEMVKEKGHEIEDFLLPNIYTMMDKVDEDWKKILKTDDAMLRDFYNSEIAEGGHTTFIGLSIAGKWLPDKSMLPDLKKSWAKGDNVSILNFADMGTRIFFYYWEKFKVQK